MASRDEMNVVELIVKCVGISDSHLNSHSQLAFAHFYFSDYIWIGTKGFFFHWAEQLLHQMAKHEKHIN